MSTIVAGLEFADRFDEILAREGPAAVFTRTPDSQLKLDLFRTRDAWQRARTDTPALEPCHCLYTDRATRFVQYVLVTSPELCWNEPRADVERYASAEKALAALAAIGTPPVRR
jgi:hypothetical protein